MKPGNSPSGRTPSLVIPLLLLRLFEEVNLFVVQFGCLYLAVGMYLFIGLLVVLYI